MKIKQRINSQQTANLNVWHRLQTGVVCQWTVVTDVLMKGSWRGFLQWQRGPALPLWRQQGPHSFLLLIVYFILVLNSHFPPYICFVLVLCVLSFLRVSDQTTNFLLLPLRNWTNSVFRLFFVFLRFFFLLFFYPAFLCFINNNIQSPWGGVWCRNVHLHASSDSSLNTHLKLNSFSSLFLEGFLVFFCFVRDDGAWCVHVVLGVGQLKLWLARRRLFAPRCVQIFCSLILMLLSVTVYLLYRTCMEVNAILLHNQTCIYWNEEEAVRGWIFKQKLEHKSFSHVWNCTCRL